MKKLMIAAASAAAIGFSAFAEDWFDGGIDKDWPANAIGGVWFNTEGSAWDADIGAVAVTAQADKPLTFAATTTNELAKITSATFTSKITFTPFPADELPAVPEDAKGGVIAVKGAESTTWYCITADEAADPQTNMWFDTEVSVGDITAAKDVMITLNTADGIISYWVDDMENPVTGDQPIVLPEDGTLGSACYAGDGSVASLVATYETDTPAFITVNIPEGEGWTATAEPTEGAEGDEVTITYTANEGKLFANGKPTITIKGPLMADGNLNTTYPTEEELETSDAKVKIGTTLYLTLDAALKEAIDDDEVTLLADIAESVVYTGDAAFTLNMAGKAWTVTGDAIALKVDNADADITITGNGSITVATGFCVWTRQGEVTIENGTFTNDDNDNYAIYAGGGVAPDFLASKVTITGGTFVNLNENPYVWQPQLKKLNLNVQNGNELATIEVSGGSYTAEPKDDTGINFVADGYYAWKQTDGTWIVNDTAPTAKIGEVFYLTLNAAIDAAKTGETVTLCKDITTDVAAAYVINKDITVDFETFTVEKTVANDWTFDIANGASVVFKGTTGGIKQVQTAKNLEWPASMIRNKGFLTIEGGVYTSDFCIIKNDEDPGAGMLTVKGGTFNIVPAAEGFEDVQMALMNWATATILGGEWNGTICTRSCDGNKVSKAGVTDIFDPTAITGEPIYMLMVGSLGDTTYENVPKISNVGSANVELRKVPTITDELELIEDGDYVTVQKKSSVGPEPAPGSQTAVVEDPENPGTYVVTPTDPEVTAVVIQGVTDTDTLVINGGAVDSLTVDSAPAAVIVKNTAGEVDITAACKGWSGNTFDAALDGTKSVEGVPVTPTLVEETAEVKPLVVGTDVSTTVKTIPGLTYTLKRGTVLGTYGDTAATATGTGAPVTLVDSAKPADKAFYVIEVTK